MAFVRSNAPWAPTGYGQQTGLFCLPLAKHYDLAISSFYGLEGAPITWNGIPVFPGIGGVFGDEHVVQHAKRFFGGDPRGGMVTSLMDVWVLDPRWMQQVNLACWVPVDHEPAPPKVVEFLINANAVPIAMSKFGMHMLGRIDPLYCPHGIDTQVYRMLNRRKAKEECGAPKDSFLVGMVAANKGRPSRKGYVQAIRAFRRLCEKHDNAYLYLHTMISPGVAGGEDLSALLQDLGVPQDRVMIADQYRVLFDPFAPESMAKIYNAMDVLLNPSLGEGFGIPIIEAQACGTPVIVTKFSAMDELCGAGWAVEHEPYWTGLNAWQAVPDVGQIADALIECATLSAKDRETLRQDARRHALQYDVRLVLREHMLPSLERAWQRFERQRPVTIAPRLRAAA